MKFTPLRVNYALLDTDDMLSFFQTVFGEIWNAFIKLKTHPRKDDHCCNVYIASRPVTDFKIAFPQQLILKSQGNNHMINTYILGFHFVSCQIY